MTIPRGYQLTDELEQMDFAKVQGWLAGTYWVPGISREETERGARNSALVVGAFDPQGAQVGFLRVVSDKVRFAYFMDVFVDPDHRKKGMAKAMVQYVFDHPDFKTVKQWALRTRDAQEVYRPLGFEPLEYPERWMARILPWQAPPKPKN